LLDHVGRFMSGGVESWRRAERDTGAGRVGFGPQRVARVAGGASDLRLDLGHVVAAKGPLDDIAMGQRLSSALHPLGSNLLWVYAPWPRADHLALDRLAERSSAIDPSSLAHPIGQRSLPGDREVVPRGRSAEGVGQRSLAWPRVLRQALAAPGLPVGVGPDLVSTTARHPVPRR
jgi:hypothetical protein